VKCGGVIVAAIPAPSVAAQIPWRSPPGPAPYEQFSLDAYGDEQSAYVTLWVD
jgi:hypothetical protein